MTRPRSQFSSRRARLRRRPNPRAGVLIRRGEASSVPGLPCPGCGARILASLDQLLAQASTELDDEKRAETIGQAYELALGEDVAAIPILFQITAWGMRKSITYGGFPQDATVAALVHGGL